MKMKNLVVSTPSAFAMLAVIGMAMSAGCGGPTDRPQVRVTGVVTLDGAPLTFGSVQFTSTKTGETAYANLDDDGRYMVTFPEADLGVEYEVTVGQPVDDELDATALLENPPEATRNVIPRKYSSRATSGLTVLISDSGETQFDVNLEGG